MTRHRFSSLALLIGVLCAGCDEIDAQEPPNPSDPKADATKDTGEPPPREPGPPPAPSHQGKTADDLSPPAGALATALDEAGKTNRHVFAFFYREEDSRTGALRKVFEGALEKAKGRATSLVLPVAAPAEQKLVRKFGLDRAPMPLAIVFAPNGAIARGFRQFTEAELLGAFVGPGQASCLKALQANKTVLLCVQNALSLSGAEALKGARDFAADPRYAKSTDVVTLDPTASSEAKFLKQLKVDPASLEAVTVILAPPGKVLGKLEGAVSKADIVKLLASCGSSCGPSGGG